MLNCYMADIPNYPDERGDLCVAECGGEGRVVPFLVKRMFYSLHVNRNAVRADHANINSRFFMISMAGSCRVTVDNGAEKETFLLDSPFKGLYVDKMLWKTMSDYSDDNILVILSDCSYDKNDYVDDYEVYKEMAGKK